jgi:hypothetical protein
MKGWHGDSLTWTLKGILVCIVLGECNIYKSHFFCFHVGVGIGLNNWAELYSLVASNRIVVEMGIDSL